MKIIQFILFLFCTGQLIAQNDFAKHWFVGENLHIEILSDAPTVNVYKDSEMNTFEQGVSYSDDQGNVLFYSNLRLTSTSLSAADEFNIWNSNNEVMPNGILGDSCGCQSSRSGAVVVPDMIDLDIYHIYMTDCRENGYNSENYKGLTHSKVDMSLDSGLGDVVVKGEHIFGDSTL